MTGYQQICHGKGALDFNISNFKWKFSIFWAKLAGKSGRDLKTMSFPLHLPSRKNTQKFAKERCVLFAGLKIAG
jgi:hypothetical protein